MRHGRWVIPTRSRSPARTTSGKRSERSGLPAPASATNGSTAPAASSGHAPTTNTPAPASCTPPHSARSDQRPHSALIDYHPTTESTDDEYPYVLITGRTLDQFNAGTMTRRSLTHALHPTDVLEISPTDATTLGIDDGDMVRVTSRYGTAVLPAARHRPRIARPSSSPPSATPPPKSIDSPDPTATRSPTHPNTRSPPYTSNLSIDVRKVPAPHEHLLTHRAPHVAEVHFPPLTAPDLGASPSEHRPDQERLRQVPCHHQTRSRL